MAVNSDLSFNFSDLLDTTSLFDIQDRLVVELTGRRELSFFGGREKLVKMRQNCLESVERFIIKHREELPRIAKKEILTYRFLSNTLNKYMAHKFVIGLSMDVKDTGATPLRVAHFVRTKGRDYMEIHYSDFELRFLYFLLEGVDLGIYLDTSEYVGEILRASFLWYEED